MTTRSPSRYPHENPERVTYCYSTITTKPVPQLGQQLVSCELHIGAFIGLEQSMNCACTFIWSFVSPDASPHAIDELPLPHLTPRILTVENPVTLCVPLVGTPQEVPITGTRYCLPTRQAKSLHTEVIEP